MSELGQNLVAEVRKIAAENPDYVYDGACVYVRDGQPACLVGKAAWNLELIDAEIENDSRNDGGVDDLVAYLEIHITYEESAWLGLVQEEQDGGSRWHSAVSKADAFDLSPLLTEPVPF